MFSKLHFFVLFIKVGTVSALGLAGVSENLGDKGVFTPVKPNTFTIGAFIDSDPAKSEFFESNFTFRTN